MVYEYIAYTALALLVVSLLQKDIIKLRWWGIASALLYIGAYYSDLVLVVTNAVIIGIHIRGLKCR